MKRHDFPSEFQFIVRVVAAANQNYFPRDLKSIESDPIDFLYDDTGGGPSKPGIIKLAQTIDAYETSGFRFKEYKIGYGERDKISHVEKGTDGEWRVTIVDTPKARYHYRRIIDFRDKDGGIHHEKRVAHVIEKSGTMIVDSKTNETIGMDVRYKHRPTLIEWQWIRFFGPGLTFCYGPLDKSEKQKRIGQIHKYVFIPGINRI